MNPSQYYSQLVAITEKLCDSTATGLSYAPSDSSCWTRLFDFWDTYTRKLSPNVFLNPMHHILFGVDAVKKPAAVQTLYRMIEDTILHCDEAYRIWTMQKKFHKAFDKVCERHTSSSTHEYYLQNRLIHLLFDSRNIDEITYHRYDSIYNVNCLSPYRDCLRDIERFQICMATLLQHSPDLPMPDLRDYEAICSRIHELYGIDYSKDAKTFDILMKLLYFLQDFQKEPPFKADFCINDIQSMISCFTSMKKMEDKILRYARKIYKTADTFSYNLFLKSWTYETLQYWSEIPEHRCCHAAKKLLFNIQICPRD